ncbi:MAG TPA: hypothetical protein VHW91_04560 [Candidatus Dormibacteraeota bacterium]|nr:hypothetical protein [Candidatus Dormibacteraeota bacterium]
MQKVLHKLIHYNKNGINLVAEVNAAIATGNDATTSASVRSSSRIVQRNGRTTTDSETQQTDEKEVNHGKTDA